MKSCVINLATGAVVQYSLSMTCTSEQYSLIYTIAQLSASAELSLQKLLAVLPEYRLATLFSALRELEKIGALESALPIRLSVLGLAKVAGALLLEGLDEDDSEEFEELPLAAGQFSGIAEWERLSA